MTVNLTDLQGFTKKRVNKLIYLIDIDDGER